MCGMTLLSLQSKYCAMILPVAMRSINLLYRSRQNERHCILGCLLMSFDYLLLTERFIKVSCSHVTFFYVCVSKHFSIIRFRKYVKNV